MSPPEDHQRVKIHVGDLCWIRWPVPGMPFGAKIVVRTVSYTPSHKRGRSRRGRRKPGIWTVRVVYPLDHPELENNIQVRHHALRPLPALVALALPEKVNTGHRTRASAPPPKGKKEHE